MRVKGKQGATALRLVGTTEVPAIELRAGSGSHKNDSSLKVVPMEKEVQTSLMHHQ